MSRGSAKDRLARTALSFLAEPADPVLGALLECASPAEIVAAVSEPGDVRLTLPAIGASTRSLARAVARWRARLDQVPSTAQLAAWHQDGVRLVCPGESEWPSQLDDLGSARPIVLWLRGQADLRYACLRSVSIVGSRAASAYGSHVATELAAAAGRARLDRHLRRRLRH